MIFLLIQATIAHPDLKEARIGTRTPFVEFVTLFKESTAVGLSILCPPQYLIRINTFDR